MAPICRALNALAGSGLSGLNRSARLGGAAVIATLHAQARRTAAVASKLPSIPCRSPCVAARGYGGPSGHSIWPPRIARDDATDAAPELLNDRDLSDPTRAVGCDFRSDTVTVPTRAMRTVLARAAVGDDVFNDDPNVQRLERHVAALLGHEAALFCASGTQANQLGLRALVSMHCHGVPASVLCDARAHVLCWEAGALAHFTGALPVAIDVHGEWVRGDRPARHLIPSDLRAAVPDDGDVHGAPTRVLAIENPIDGDVMGVAQFNELVAAARDRGLAVHLDGARLWNACVVEGVDPRTYAAACDSVSVCLSKGIGAPIGSVLAGNRELVRRARHWRKALGGGMRQAGILAAAALHALKEGYPVAIERAHAFARQLADGLEGLGLYVDNTPVQTNMVFVDLSAAGLVADDIVRAAQNDDSAVRVSGGTGHNIRFVTHYQLADDAVPRLLATIQSAIDRSRQQTNSDAADQNY